MHTKPKQLDSFIVTNSNGKIHIFSAQNKENNNTGILIDKKGDIYRVNNSNLHSQTTFAAKCKKWIDYFIGGFRVKNNKNETKNT